VKSDGRRISLSAAVFVLICFFMPWVQVSCLGVKASDSGTDIARNDDRLLWAVPILMLIILLFGLTRAIWERNPFLFSLAGIVGGGFSAYLMYRRHSALGKSADVLGAQWTVWCWLGLAASVVVAASALLFYSKKSRSP